jgi:hypothetical protein
MQEKIATNSVILNQFLGITIMSQHMRSNCTNQVNVIILLAWKPISKKFSIAAIDYVLRVWFLP